MLKQIDQRLKSISALPELWDKTISNTIRTKQAKMEEVRRAVSMRHCLARENQIDLNTKPQSHFLTLLPHLTLPSPHPNPTLDLIHKTVSLKPDVASSSFSQMWVNSTLSSPTQKDKIQISKRLLPQTSSPKRHTCLTIIYTHTCPETTIHHTGAGRRGGRAISPYTSRESPAKETPLLVQKHPSIGGGKIRKIATHWIPT